MALITCPECKKNASDHVESCPYCGYPLDEFPKKTICSECSQRIEINSEVCPNCGFPTKFTSKFLEASGGLPPKLSIEEKRVSESFDVKFDVKYLFGIPDLSKEFHTSLRVESEGISLYRFNKIKAKIKYDDLVQVQVKKETELIPGKEKDKSVIGRSIAGGLLMGPLGGMAIGAVVGGMDGVGKKTIKNSKKKDNWFVLVAFRDSGIPCIATFSPEALVFNEKKARQISQAIITCWRNYSRKNIKKMNENLEIEDANNSSFEGRLERLKKLYDSNLITSEEYDKRKSEILSEI